MRPCSESSDGPPGNAHGCSVFLLLNLANLIKAEYLVLEWESGRGTLMGGEGVAGAQVMRGEVSSGAGQMQMLVALWAPWRERGLPATKVSGILCQHWVGEACMEGWRMGDKEPI